MTKLAFTEAPFIPRNLDWRAFSRLTIEVVERIHAGKLKVPEEWKRRYADFYIEQPEPLDET
jgi:hypothetical protein